MSSFEEELLVDYEKKLRTNPKLAYELVLPAVKNAQKLGIKDEDIEVLYGVKIHPKDKQKPSQP